ncbi:hypothetical protein VTJ83DRAFT_2113 [Remersonia thermophila]|uniref:Cyanovirin-N domain-containing protein n=1 Tax=Remersonia thermophila TaxID=72144 RepID=A0ABR4DIS3_9PEZI
MRPVARSSQTLGLVALVISGVVTKQAVQIQEFTKTCAYSKSTLSDGHHWLRTACRHDMMAVWGYDTTWLDLDNCVGNLAGKLVVQDRGRYSASCSKCRLYKEWQIETMMLECSCIGLDGTVHITDLDLNTALRNQHGTLACFDHVGNSSAPRP